MTQLDAQPQARNEIVAVGLTSLELFKGTFLGQPRKMFAVRNTSPNALDIITLSLGGNAAVANTGIVLRQNDVYMESTVNDPSMDVWQGVIQAICATANGQLSIVEV